MANQAILFKDYLRVAVRWKWLILCAVVISAAIAWGVCLVWPKSYRSATTILIESQKIPETYVKGVMTGTVQERLANARQIVLSRPLLTQVIREVGLVQKEGSDKTLEEILGKMVKSVSIEIPREQPVMKLSYAHSDPTWLGM